MKAMSIRDVWESFDRKFNASDTRKGRRTANDEFANTVVGLLESKKIGWGDISFKELHEGLVVDQDLEEAYDSSGMPTVLSQLISKKVIDAYQAYPQNGLKLVNVVPSSLKEEVAVGWTSVGQISEVKERDFYEEKTPPDEKFVKIPNKKYGGILSITEEIIKFDQTSQFLARAAAIGERGAQFLDKLIMKGLIDADSNVYNKGQLYKTDNTNSNYLSGADSALGTKAWETAHFSLHEKTDEAGEPIWVSGDRPILMCSPRNVPTAIKLRQGDYGNIGTANLDVNVAQNMFDIVENPYFASLTTTTAWLYGSFKRQFQYNEIFPLQVFSRAGQDTAEGFKRDIVQQFKVRLYGGIGALDTKYVIYNAGA